MHEYSIVSSLIEICEEHVKKNSATKVTKLVVKIGVMSGVEPHLLKEAFDGFKLKSVCEEAEFVMNIQNIVIECKECGEQSELTKREFFCPKCESVYIDVIDGEDMFLMSLELE